MRRFGRWMLNGLAVLSLILSIAICSAYFRNHLGDSFYMRNGDGQYWSLDIDPKSISFDWSDSNQRRHKSWSLGHRRYGTRYYQLPIRSFWNRLGFWSGYSGQVRLPNGDYEAFHQEILPPWLGCLFILFPVTWGIQKARRRTPGHAVCVNCGYNLTGNISGVCPECGKPIPSSA
jgi:hypothetical protein